MTLSADLIRIYTSAPTDDRYVETMQLSHPGFPSGTRYLTNERTPWTARLETGDTVDFQPAPISIVLPKAGEKASQTMQVVIDNADRGLMEELERLSLEPTTPIDMVYRVYLLSNPNTVQNPPGLKLDILGVVATNQHVSFNAGLPNLRKWAYPRLLYTHSTHPGLAR